MGRGLFIGLNTIDIQFLLKHYPSANSKSKAEKYGIFAGGPATNAAICFSYLCGHAHLVSVFGQHSLNRIILDELSDYKVTFTDVCPYEKDPPTFASITTTQKRGDRSVISYHPKHHKHTWHNLDEVDIHNYDVVLVDGFYMDLAIYFAKLAREANIPVVLDGGSWKKNMQKLLPYVDVAICSENFQPPQTKGSKNILVFLKKHGIKEVAITRGNKPIITLQRDKFEKTEVKKIKATDTLGAGDIFHGAFCYYFSKKHSFVNALKRASVVAAKSCLSFGTREWMHD